MTALDPRVETLLHEAADWRLIGLMFECPSPEWRRQLTALAPEAGDAELRQAAADACAQGDEGLYHSTFGPGGPAPPREATYRDTLQLGYLMSELGAFYTAFGYKPATFEPEDHIAVEAGFISYLKLKQAFAISAGDQTALEVAHDAEKEFLSEHLASIAEPLAASIGSSGVTYWKAAAAAMQRRAGAAKKRFVVLATEDLQQEEGAFGCGEDF